MLLRTPALVCSISLVILGLKGKTSAADQVNFSLSGPTSPEAQICYGRLASSNATQEKCLSAAETQWNVTVSVIGNGTEPSEAQCNAWTSSLQCIDEAICKLCSKPEIADIGQWELAAYENRSFCGLDSTKAPIDWCKNRTVGQDNSSFSSSSSAASSKVKSSSPIVITIVAVLMLTMIILAGIAIILMINAPDKEDSKGDDGHQSTAKTSQSDFSFSSLLDVEKSQLNKGPFKSKISAKLNGKLLGKSKMDKHKVGRSGKSAKHWSASLSFCIF